MNQPNKRKLEYIEEYQKYIEEYQNCDRWAVIVGISQYEYQPWNLNYAHRDAEELCQLLCSESGGNFKKQNINLLTNENATKSNIEDALYDFLKKPDEDDLVIIFFACHGAPDPDIPENIYLLPYDTNPEKIASTGIQMRAIDSVLKHTLSSKKVIIFADACHSGNIGGGIGKEMKVRAGDEESMNELINKYLRDLTQSEEGIALLTSAEAREVARESQKWGGGHGVFTHFVLEGMKGAADRDKNGIITVGELFEYVREKVKEATDNRQHPSIGTNPYDRNLPIAIRSLETNGNSDKNKFVQELTNEVFLEMVLIPEGSFQMGSNENIEEQPVHEVTMQPFFMSKYPITQEQWRAVTAWPKVKHELNPELSRFKGDNLPVERVSWYDAKEFCARLSQKTGREYRLPSEAEWEYACRADPEKPADFDDKPTSSTANCNDELIDLYQTDEYEKETTPVDRFSANAFDLWDMQGNVYEWCEDFWYPNYKGATIDGTARQKNIISNNQPERRLLRGGSRVCEPKNCRCAFRNYTEPNDRYNIIGFRVVCNFAT